ncbi:hypothetical protein PGT21_014598 [Puccinia graminis f. sp. tritici]|uniref:Uncharacterized protein n=1 Tax=Puccinia graminis f. sp. tritici TaxID=56615 RepID=A0A5B0PF25_PUCGR|nr:hypothetical protein PGTUg99_011411 [Puccinia graminis f. sp. tritici]KAA1099606.1 hypothetical protein PGT21_014598 [Puccinia graminis f. sp. tritici]
MKTKQSLLLQWLNALAPLLSVAALFRDGDKCQVQRCSGSLAYGWHFLETKCPCCGNHMTELRTSCASCKKIYDQEPVPCACPPPNA